MVLASILWPNYRVGTQPLGQNNPNFTININLNNASASTVSQFWMIQSVYIDNENCNFPVYVYFPDTQFTVSCPPNSSGWYQVFTIARNVLVTALGISDFDIQRGAKTGVFFTDAEMVPYLDQEEQTAVNMQLASPVISIGGGGQILAINVANAGSCYADGGLSITGGGGAGAQATGQLDQYGRFIGATITNPGSGYSGFPVITPTAGFNPPPLWNGQPGVAGQQRQFLGTIWLCTVSNAFSGGWAPQQYQPGNIVSFSGSFYTNTTIALPGEEPPNNPWVPYDYPTPNADPGHWQNSGVIPDQTATFSSQVASIVSTGSSSTSSYAASALGDQAANYIDVVAGGIFRQNLFATPFSQGFINITNIYINQLKTGNSLAWQLEDAAGAILFTFQGAAANGPIFELQRCNIRLVASEPWQLRCTEINGSFVLSHGFAWTYSLI